MNWFAFGQALVEGRQQRKEIDAQREIEKFNIKNDEQNARLVGQQTSAREEMQRRESRHLLGSQRAGIAQSGVGFSGSSGDIIRQSTASAELDALNVRYAGDLERYGILNEIEMRKYNDKLLEKRGKQVMRMRWGTAMAGLFGGGGSTGKLGEARESSKGYGQGGGTSHGWASGARGTYGGMGKATSAPKRGTGPN